MGVTKSKPANKTGSSVTNTKISMATKTGVLSLSEHNLKEVPASKIIAAFATAGSGGGKPAVLRALDLSSNALESVASSLLVAPCVASSLKTLKLERNKLQVLPEQLEYLLKLQTLDASENRLSAVPANLPQTLETLRLAANPKIGRVPASLFRDFAKLVVLDLSGCGLSELPEDAESYATSSQLRELALDDNALVVVPVALARLAQLRVLSLRRNRIIAAGLPPELFAAPHLERLDLHTNPITKRQLLDRPGVDALLDRRAKTRTKDGTMADLSLCGLDD